MGWSYLLVAIILEVAWASTLKWTDGYTRPGPSLVNLVLCLANIFFLSQAIKVLPTALAYSIWTGLGAVGVAIVAFCHVAVRHVQNHQVLLQSVNADGGDIVVGRDVLEGHD